MVQVIVEVMPKTDYTDPRGAQIANALNHVGFDGVIQVRQGKRFELGVDGPVNNTVLAQASQIAKEVLANPVTEDVTAVFVQPSRGEQHGGHKGAV
ncbi:MAG TPA: phosphoribosylformylglycinamidine synthase subunit PurS [Beutenbergiaceae bacterium]|nr:phosphoribosylformylglycinamidine synthase subunit PurS [Beutenbergiaceae bacterium]